MDAPPSMKQGIVDAVSQIPAGRVARYGDIAAQLGIQDVRLVGWALHVTGDIPGFLWWRVINNEGKIAIKDSKLRIQQRESLIKEGVEVGEDFVLDMEVCCNGGPRRQKLLWGEGLMAMAARPRFSLFVLQ